MFAETSCVFLVLKIPVYQSSAEFSGRFLLKGRSCKMFNIIAYTKTVLVYNFDLGGGRRGATGSSPAAPLWVRACYRGTQQNIFSVALYTWRWKQNELRIAVIACNTRKKNSKLNRKINNFFKPKLKYLKSIVPLIFLKFSQCGEMQLQ
jgi:hypothetical protein